MNIKKILVPTDFSDTANNALLYAVDLAKQFDAQIELIHAVLVPVLTARGKIFLPDQEVVDSKMSIAEELLNKAKSFASEKSGIRINTDATLINWQLELGEAIHNRDGDIIIMGTTGASCLEKIFMGSNAARIVQNSPIPVLAIPVNVRFSPVKKIGIAYDGLELKVFERLSIVNSLRNKFNASIDIFQIITKNQTPSANLSELINYLPGASTNYVYERGIESGILNAVETNSMDILTMIPRQRGFFHNLIAGSITRRVAYKISVPLLAIPE
jgi:nucleotide-binding universal stress UspA family protein